MLLEVSFNCVSALPFLIVIFFFSISSRRKACRHVTRDKNSLESSRKAVDNKAVMRE